jgi:DNA-binding response OmpR family regulator
VFDLTRAMNRLPDTVPLRSVLVIDRWERPSETWRVIADLLAWEHVEVVPDPSAVESSLTPSSHDLILCSYRFPEDSATDFAARLRARSIAMPILIFSDLLDTRGVMEAAAISGTDFLSSPFLVTDLRDRVRILLAGTAQEA